MAHIIGIRREDKNVWEKRTPLVPRDVDHIIDHLGIDVYVQPSNIRVYANGEYKEVGAKITEDLSPCEVIFGVKEMPINFFSPGGTYVFFSHTLKGQHYNMPHLKRMMDLKCNLIDYEGITNENDRRLIFFGRHAGQAGMIDSLWALGEKLKKEGVENPFYEIRQTYEYRHLKAAKDDMKLIAERIIEDGLPEELTPMVIGIAGYGNVSRGAQEVLDFLPVKEISPQELLELKDSKKYYSRHIYQVVFKEDQIVTPKDPIGQFDLNNYYTQPQNYKGDFDKYLPHLTVLINAIYWTEKYPRLVTREATQKLYKAGDTRLKVIGDISCDINGAIEMNTHATDPGDPVYMFDPISGNTENGFKQKGICILAVDNLPCELAKESSIYFSNILSDMVKPIVECNYSVDFAYLDLPPELRRGLIVHKGMLTPKYEYLEEFIEYEHTINEKE